MVPSSREVRITLYQHRCVSFIAVLSTATDGGGYFGGCSFPMR